MDTVLALCRPTVSASMSDTRRIPRSSPAAQVGRRRAGL